MTAKITRKQWTEIEKRVKLAEFQFNKSERRCLIDGRAFHGHDCEHDVEDNLNIIEEVKERLRVVDEYRGRYPTLS